MKSFSAVDKKGRRPSEIEMMKKQLKKVPGSDSEDEKVRTQVCMQNRVGYSVCNFKRAFFFIISIDVSRKLGLNHVEVL